MFIRSKFIAVLLGANGVGIYSQILNVSNLIVVLIPIGSVGITRFLSDFYEEGKIHQINYLLRRILAINIPLVLIIGSVFIIFSRTISELLYSNNEYWILILIFSISVPLGLFNVLIDIYLKSVRKISLYVRFVSINAIVSLILFIPLILIFKIEGVIASFFFTYLVGILVGYLILKRNSILPHLKIFEKLEPGVLKSVYKTGLIMVIIYIIQQLSNIVIRSLIANTLSILELGIYQSVYAISNNYFALFFTIMYTYSFPKFSTFKSSSEIIKETNETLKFLVMIYTPLIIIFFVFRVFFIRLLYSSDFIYAKELLFYQLLGDYFKMLSWVLAIWLIPNLKLKAWAFFDIIFFVNYFSIFYYLFFFTGLGILSISISYLISYAFHLVLNFIYIKKEIKFIMSKDNKLKVAVSAVTIALMFLIAQNSQLLAFITIVPVLTIWLLVSVKKSEMIELKSLVTGYFKQRS